MVGYREAEARFIIALDPIDQSTAILKNANASFLAIDRECLLGRSESNTTGRSDSLQLPMKGIHILFFHYPWHKP